MVFFCLPNFLADIRNSYQMKTKKKISIYKAIISELDFLFALCFEE